MKYGTLIKILLAVFFVAMFYYQGMMMLQLSQMDEMKIDYISLILMFLSLFVLMLSINKKILNQRYAKITKLLIFIFLVRTVVDMLTDTGNMNSKIVATLQAILIPAFLLLFYSLFQSYNFKALFFKCVLALLVGLVGVYIYILLFRNEYAFVGIYASLNASYFFIILLPCILFATSNTLVRAFSIICVTVLVFSSMKRGGIIAWGLSLLVYYIINVFVNRKNREKKRRIFPIISFLLLSITLIFLFIQFDLATGGYIIGRFDAISEDEGSGRLGIYMEVIAKIQKSDFISFIFGHGRLAVEKVTAYGMPAHNDFLEMFYDYGAIMFILYVAFHTSFLLNIFKLIRIKSAYAPIMAMSYVSFFIFSMISHVFLYSYFLFYIMLWGSVWGTLNRESCYASYK